MLTHHGLMEQPIPIFKPLTLLSKEELTSLLKEIRVIGNAEVPKDIKQSKIMKELFRQEKTEYNFWSDQYYEVNRTLNNEILFRIRTDNW